MSDEPDIDALREEWSDAPRHLDGYETVAGTIWSLLDEVDRLRAALVAHDHRVLWTGPTRRLSNTDESEIYVQLPVSAGTVVVVSRDNQNDTTEEE